MAWQYRTLYVDPNDLSELQWYGQEGWETFAAGRVGGLSDQWIIWLKKIVGEPEYDVVKVISTTPDGSSKEEIRLAVQSVVSKVDKVAAECADNIVDTYSATPPEAPKPRGRKKKS